MIILVTALAELAIFSVLCWIAAKISNSVGSIAERLSSASSTVSSSVGQLNEAGNIPFDDDSPARVGTTDEF